MLTHILSHLPPETLSSMSLVCRRFHKLVTTPPAWRIAFARYFPGAESIATVTPPSQNVENDRNHRRVFTRLSALASWRSEYILRTRLLRSLARGRPALQALSKPSTSRHTGSHSAAAVVSYQSGLMFPVSHLHATFGVGLNKKQPLFIHGAAEQGLVSSSDPGTGKIDGWGLADYQAFRHFTDVFAGEPEYGLGPGNVVGMSNVLDVSQSFGKVYGEACPGGRLYFTSTTEQRGRFITVNSTANHVQGIPNAPIATAAVTSVWIAKTEAVLKTTNGLFGMLAGFSDGVLAAYALGASPIYDRRFEKGEPTARWVLCPGVPIIAISVDEKVSRRKVEAGRIWAVVLNALGEVYILKDLPLRPESKGRTSPSEQDRIAWQVGRSVDWSLVETTRRVAKPDPYSTSAIDGSYTPKLSADLVGLDVEQRTAELREVETFLKHKPKHFQNLCDGWDMQRRLLVDYAGDDRCGGGESIVLIQCGLQDGQTSSIQRITRCRKKVSVDYDLEAWPSVQQGYSSMSILREQRSGTGSPSPVPRSRTSSTDDVNAKFEETWFDSNFAFGDLRHVQITAVASDDSDFAVLTTHDDPLLGMSGGSQSSSPLGSPMSVTPGTIVDIPGQRARLMTVGTKTGIVMCWDMRSALSPAPDIVNNVQPVRVIHTKSPQISSLALTALYVVHGGNDGLVQAWDPLASTIEPIRTLNSRFSDRARRRIAQADASVHGVGHNYFAAGAIILDPDPTVLRGMVSLGTHLRYWSYSSTAADAYKSKKRAQLRRRSDRGSNAAPTDHKVTATGRGMLKDYIFNEQIEMEREKAARRKENKRMSGRFGTNLLGTNASDEEMLAYATMLSEESWANQQAKQEDTPELRASAIEATTDPDMEEAIRLSLLENESHSSPSQEDFSIPIRYAKTSKRAIDSPRSKAAGSKMHKSTEQDDLEFALQLSLAEERSKAMAEAEFPPLEKSRSSSSGKGKGKGRRG